MEEKKEITIAYGNEVQLTTTGEKNKQVFVKLSPAFRNNQLKELKGAPLSVFLCYALHSDENGYCWVDNKKVAMETGFSESQIMEAKKKLRRKNYLFDAKCFEPKTKQYRDWIYRIFQPIENGKEFIIRGKKLISRSVNLAELGKKPNSGKLGGIIEEEPLNSKEEEPINGDSQESPSIQTLKRKEFKASPEEYKEITDAYQRYKGIELSGAEFGEVKRAIKTMLYSGRTKENIIAFMRFCSDVCQAIKEGDKDIEKRLGWLQDWTMLTIKRKMPEFLAGKFKKVDDDETLEHIPEIARSWLK